MARPADMRWDPLLLCVAGHILTAVGRVHQLFPALEVLRPAMLTGLLATVLYVLDRHQERRLDRIFTPTTKYLLAFLIWMVLSVPGALVVGNSLELVFGSFIKTVLLFILVAGAVRGVRDVERLAMVYLLAAAAYASVAIAEFNVGAGADWRLGHLFYYDANDLATFLVTAMPLGLYFLHGGRRLTARVFALVALALITVAFVRTGSRGGFIALVAMAGFVVLRYSAIPLGRRVAVTAFVAVVVVGTASELADRQQFGVGVRWNAAHNSYVQVGAELGIVGLGLFLTVIASAFVALRRARPDERTSEGTPDRLTQLTQALTASLIGFVVGAFFLSLAYSEMLYTLLAMAVGLKKVAAVRDTVDDRARAVPIRSVRRAR